jgi:cyclic pyranopterin phosphate synthase
MARKKTTPTRRRVAAPRLTHMDESGRPRMVDVIDKPVSERRALAEGTLRMNAATLARLLEGGTPKGDPLVVARIAGIQAAKRTAGLIPFCHPLALTHVEVEIETDDAIPGIRAIASAGVAGRTGVEMEALTAVAVALLTAYDMLKAIDRGMVLGGIRLLEKEGGRSGRWRASAAAPDITNSSG